MGLMEDRITLVSAEFPGSDDVKPRLCHSLGTEKIWTSSDLLSVQSLSTDHYFH